MAWARIGGLFNNHFPFSRFTRTHLSGVKVESLDASAAAKLQEDVVPGLVPRVGVPVPARELGIDSFKSPIIGDAELQGV